MAQFGALSLLALSLERATSTMLSSTKRELLGFSGKISDAPVSYVHHVYMYIYYCTAKRFYRTGVSFVMSVATDQKSSLNSANKRQSRTSKFAVL